MRTIEGKPLPPYPPLAQFSVVPLILFSRPTSPSRPRDSLVFLSRRASRQMFQSRKTTGKLIFVAPLRRRLLTSLTRLGIRPVFALGHLVGLFFRAPSLTLRMALLMEVAPQSSRSSPFTW
jgi:hypothetical protein